MTQPQLQPREARETAEAVESAGAAPLDVAPESGASRVGRTLGARAAGSLVLLLAMVVGMETAARLQDWVRYRMPMLSRVTAEEDLFVRDSLGAHGRAGAQFKKWKMDSLGLRGPEVPVRRPAGTVRVVVTGASESFGLYESPDEEYPRQLEDTLNAELARGVCGSPRPRRFDVLNAALPGMSLPTVVQDLHARLARLAPDVVLYYPSPAQYLENDPPRATPPDTTHRLHDLPRANVLHLRALAQLRDALKGLMPEPLLTWLRHRSAESALAGHPASWRFAGVPPDRLARFDLDLRGAVGAIRAVRAEPVLATHASIFTRPHPDSAAQLQAWQKFYPRATGATIIAFDAAADRQGGRIATDSGVVLADVAAVFAARDGAYFADFVHFTDAGSALVAGTMAPAVLSAARRRGLCGTPDAVAPVRSSVPPRAGR